MWKLLKDIIMVPASFKDFATQAVISLIAGLTVINATGQPQNWKDYAAISVAFLAGWAGMTTNRKGKVQ